MGPIVQLSIVKYQVSGKCYSCFWEMIMTNRKLVIVSVMVTTIILKAHCDDFKPKFQPTGGQYFVIFGVSTKPQSLFSSQSSGIVLLWSGSKTTE